MVTLLIILAAIGMVIALVVLGPSDYRVERSVLVDASAAAVFRRINDLRRWADWSPWEKADAGMSRSYSGPGAGIGAGYSWSGNRRVGAGRMTIIESRASEAVGITLEFQRPFKAVCSVDFSLRNDSGATRVTWVMIGKNNFVAKLFSLFVSVDKMIGREFENGLATLKRLCEAEPAQRPAASRSFEVPKTAAANSNALEPPADAE